MISLTATLRAIVQTAMKSHAAINLDDVNKVLATIEGLGRAAQGQVYSYRCLRCSAIFEGVSSLTVTYCPACGQKINKSKSFEDRLEEAFGIICDVEWAKQNNKWIQAAKRFRDEYINAATIGIHTAVTLDTCRQIAARIWCDKEYQHIVMNVDLCENIANLLYRYASTGD